MKSLTKTAALALLATAALAAPAAAEVRVGMLDCRVSPGVGAIVTSHRTLDCVFQGAGRTERYTGDVRRVGLDIGVTGPGRLLWAVVAVARPVPGALAGQYVGASVSATPLVGLGANALVGGFNDSLILQPISIEGQTGLHVAAGIGSLRLQAEGRVARR